MEDITPELLNDIQKQFNRDYGANKAVQNLLDKINNGKANYDDLNEYAQKSVKYWHNLSKEFIK